MAPIELASLADELSAQSALEMVDAIGLRRAPGVLRRLASLPLGLASRPLGRMLAEFDHETGLLGLPVAAGRTLERLRVNLTTSGACPEAGPLLVLANHPGAYDTLALMSALARRDLLIVAADRSFLRALPRVSEHLVFVADGGSGMATRRALSHLRAGGALLHFPAGCIEPDPDFAPSPGAVLEHWRTPVLPFVRAAARASGKVILAGVRGVHSQRIKRLWFTRFAERHGVTTLATLLQIIARARDVQAHVAFSPARRAAELVALHDRAQINFDLRRDLETTLTNGRYERALLRRVLNTPKVA
jgi:hypothetical protein